MQGNNLLTLTGAGRSDGVGMTVDNVIFYKMDSTHKSVSGSNCVCASGYYDDGTTFCATCISRDPGCNTCGTYPIIGFACVSCISGYYKPTFQPCATCSSRITGCLTCNSGGTICTACNEANNYFTSPTNSSICALCNLNQCITCDSLT